MGTVKNATYKVHNGVDFDEIHFKTKAAQVICANGKTVESQLEDKANYECGAWTPVLGTGNTGTVIPCTSAGSYYEKTNNKVSCYFVVSVQNWNVPNPNELLIMTGFPFPMNTKQIAIGEICEYGGVSSSAEATGGLGIYRQGTTFWIGRRTSQNIRSMIVNHFDKSFYFLGKIEYTI